MKQHGFSVIAALVGIVLVGIAAWVLSSAVVDNKQWGFKADRRVQVTRIIVDTVSHLMSQEYSYLRQLCAGPPNRFAPTPVSGRCLSADGSFNMGSESTPNPLVPRLFDVRRDWMGAFANDGKVCLELVQCRDLAGGRMIDFTVRAYWKDPSGQRQALTHQMQARKARS